MTVPAVAVGVISSGLTNWLVDQLPKPGLSPEENARRLRNTVFSIMASVGVAYVVTEIAKRAPTETQTQVTGKKIVLPGYYE